MLLGFLQNIGMPEVMICSLVMVPFGIMTCVHAARRALWEWFARILVSTLIVFPLLPVIVVYGMLHRRTPVISRVQQIAVAGRAKVTPSEKLTTVYCPKCGAAFTVVEPPLAPD